MVTPNDRVNVLKKKVNQGLVPNNNEENIQICTAFKQMTVHG